MVIYAPAEAQSYVKRDGESGLSSKERIVRMYVETNCPSCRALKSFLNSTNVKFSESNIDNPDNRVEALMLNVYSVPALVLGSKVLRANEIFDSNNSLRKERIIDFIERK